MEVFKSPIQSLVVISYVNGARNYSDVISFVRDNFSNRFKRSNVCTISKRLEELGLIRTQTSEQYNEKIIVFNQAVFEDYFKAYLRSVVDDFYYSFKLEGKKRFRKKRFSYESRCENIEPVFNFFKEYSMRVILSVGQSTFVTAKEKHLSVYGLFENMIIGLATDKDFVLEDSTYLTEDNLITLFPTNFTLTRLQKVCKEYLAIKNINNYSKIASRIIHQD